MGAPWIHVTTFSKMVRRSMSLSGVYPHPFAIMSTFGWKLPGASYTNFWGRSDWSSNSHDGISLVQYHVQLSFYWPDLSSDFLSLPLGYSNWNSVSFVRLVDDCSNSVLWPFMLWWNNGSIKGFNPFIGMPENWHSSSAIVTSCIRVSTREIPM